MTRPEDAQQGDSGEQAPEGRTEPVLPPSDPAGAQPADAPAADEPAADEPVGGVPAEPPLEAPPAPHAPVVERTAAQGAALAGGPVVAAGPGDGMVAEPVEDQDPAAAVTLADEEPVAAGDGPAEEPDAGEGPAAAVTLADEEPVAAEDGPVEEPSLRHDPAAELDVPGGPVRPAEPAPASDDRATDQEPTAAQTVALSPTTADLAVPAAAPLAPAVPAAEGTATGSTAPEPDDDVVPTRRGGLARAALAAALVLLVAAAAVLGWQVRGAALDRQAREQALTAARQSALNLTSIDREDFAGDVARVLDGATGEFRSDFAGRVDELEQLLEENEVAAEGRVLEAGLVRADRTSATALVVVDSTVRNRTVPEGRVNSYRMKIEVERVGGQWRTSSLEFVG